MIKNLRYIPRASIQSINNLKQIKIDCSPNIQSKLNSPKPNNQQQISPKAKKSLTISWNVKSQQIQQKLFSEFEQFPIPDEETQRFSMTQKSIILKLIEMGYQSLKVHRFVQHLKPKTIEDAISNMDKGIYGWEHKFISSKKQKKKELMNSDEVISEIIDMDWISQQQSQQNPKVGQDLCVVCLQSRDEHRQSYNLVSEYQFSFFSESMSSDFVVNKQKVKQVEVKKVQIVGVQNPERSKQFQCMICCLFYQQREQTFSLNCGHQFCKNCVIGYLQNKIDQAQVNVQIPCPYGGDCKHLFNFQTLKQILQPQKIRKYLKFRQNYIVNINPNKRWCPRPDCGNFVQKKLGRGQRSKVKCKCGYEFCFLCGQPWHPRSKCNSALDQKYKQYVRRNKGKNCPKCKIRMERISGCNHMTCGYQFCWACSEEYTEYHYSKFNFIFGCIGDQDGFEYKCCQLLIRFLVLLSLPILLYVNLWIMSTVAYFQEYQYQDTKTYIIARKLGQRFEESKCKFFGVVIWVLFFTLPFLWLILLLPAYYVTLKRIFYILKTRAKDSDDDYID